MTIPATMTSLVQLL